MALILTLKKGERFYVGENIIEVTAIYSDAHFSIKVDDGAEFDVLDDKMVEVIPEVFVSVGNRHVDDLARVAVEAPRSVPILREKLKRGTPLSL